jgi:hypothetical protein
MPTPAAALLVLSPLIILDQSIQEASRWAPFWGLFSVALMAATAVLMNIYPIRYLHLGRFMSRHPWFARVTLLLLIVSIFSPYFGHISLAYMTGFLLSPLITWRINPEMAAKESRVEPAEVH